MIIDNQKVQEFLEDKEDAQSKMAALGAICFAFFVALPLNLSGIIIGDFTSYMSEAGVEKYLFLVAPVIAYFVRRRWWLWAIGGVMPLALLAAAMVIGHLLRVRVFWMWPYSALGFLHWLLLFAGTCLLVASPVWEFWPGSRQSDPDTIAPKPIRPVLVAPKVKTGDPTVGLCNTCGMKNPRALTRCHNCGVALPWAIPQTKQASPIASNIPKVGRISPPAFLERIDWGYGLVAFVSFLFIPIGILLYFVYTADDNEKSRAAAIGAGVSFFLIVLRVTGVLVKVAG